MDFKFRPTAPKTVAELFNLVSVSDIDGNGRPEILGSFTPWVVDSLEASPLPAVITWDDADQSYRMFPLLDHPVRYRRKFRQRGVWGDVQERLYHRQVILTDPENGEALRGYTVLGFAAAKTSLGEPAILTSFTAKATCHFCGGQSIEVQMSTARYQPPPETFGCPRSRPVRSEGILIHPPSREFVIARPSAYLAQNADRLARQFECD